MIRFDATIKISYFGYENVPKEDVGGLTDLLFPDGFDGEISSTEITFYENDGE